MKALIFYVAVTFFTLSSELVQAQEQKEPTRQEYLENQKEKILEEEKGKLKAKLAGINRRLEEDEISPYEADRMRKEEAEKHALNIKNRTAILENEVALQERNSESGGYQAYIGLGEDGKALTFKVNGERERKYDKRTYSDIVLAAGFNNALADGQGLNDSDFKIAGSRFFEIGWSWRTRVFENSNWLRIKYGFSFTFNGLKPTNNRYFVEEGDQTVLQEYSLNLKKSKFRTDNLVFPFYFEVGPSQKKESETSIRYSTANKFKLGLGGYAGFNIGERQKLKFEENGENVKQKLKNDYNTNDAVYGLAGYVGWGGATLYARYGLNSIFRDNPVELHMVSLGLRFDID
ncbi:MAG: hypothetical protein WBV11_01525 [Salegentibacter sp.]